MKAMFVFLGNVGKDYDKTRHNAGFMMGEAFANTFKDLESNHGKTYCAYTYKECATILLYPTTLMNSSGTAVVEAVEKFKPDKIYVVQDDIYLPLGTIRFKESGGGCGGQNGIRNIDALYPGSYTKIKIGIGPAPEKDLGPFVMGKFTDKELEIMAETQKQFVKRVKELL
jgi:PTH1 family peptidyl-tRNA hydrolase